MGIATSNVVEYQRSARVKRSCLQIVDDCCMRLLPVSSVGTDMNKKLSNGFIFVEPLTLITVNSISPASTGSDDLALVLAISKSGRAICQPLHSSRINICQTDSVKTVHCLFFVVEIQKCTGTNNKHID